MDGNIRSDSVEMMPGVHGGMLRRGGGRPSESKEVLEVKAIIKSGAKDAAAALMQRARKGDVKAIEMVLHYAIGKPTDKIELTGADGGPIEHAQTFTDHEWDTLKQAIDRELAVRATAYGPADGDEAADSVASVGPGRTEAASR